MSSTRRSFLKATSLSTLAIPTLGLGYDVFATDRNDDTSPNLINFISDGLFFSPERYIAKLQRIQEEQAIEADFYHNGGATKALEERFAQITGKEKAIFLPTGTMANQLAIKLLNGENTKVLVPENSHIFRDEADAAQAVHGKRLIPVGKGKAYFTKADLEETIAYYNKGEVFKSGLGTITVEHPIRRADGVAVPLEELQAISGFCREQGYHLHLDGARIHIASAYTGISIADYAALFDTVYISLYKYLNGAFGAMLCGDAELIDKISHQIKILGGTTFHTWTSTAMALHYLDGIETRWQEVVTKAGQLVKGLNEFSGISIAPIGQGTNIYKMQLERGIDGSKLSNILFNEHHILLRRADANGIRKLIVNESLLEREIGEVLVAWKTALNQAKS